MSTPAGPPEYRHYLREWREKRGLVQEQLAKMVGTSTSVISRFETGERHMKLEMQFKLITALGIKPQQLFFHPDDNELEALLARASPELRAQLVKMVKPLVD
jgi:transcriptional regulator with XRE-family HTH domain